MYPDFSSAFDKVPHKRLLHKLHHQGIRGKLLRWIGNYLEARTFQTRVRDSHSRAYRSQSGVPQGSVLGPLLFVLYSADLYYNTKSRHATYADDTKIYAEPESQFSTLQADLDNIATWSDTWLIPLNPQKCVVLHLGKRRPRRTYHINSCVLATTPVQKDLGILVTKNLQWDCQVNSVIKKANYTLYCIRRAFLYISTDLLRKLFVMYVQPILEYCSVVWSPYFQKDIDAMERVLRRASKLSPSTRQKPYETRLRELDLQSLSDRREQTDLVETFKILTREYNVPDLHDIFEMAPQRSLRGHQLKLRMGRFNRLPRKYFLGNRVVQIWNQLPADTVCSASVDTFKRALTSP